jgi:hypothetical protein
MSNKSFRIKYDQNSSIDHLKVNMKQDFDFLEVLSLKISQEDAYKLYTSDYGVIVGRVLANDGFGIPNAKISLFIKNQNVDNSTDSGILYPYTSTSSVNSNNVRYNLLPSEKVNKCHQNVGSFVTKTELLDNNQLIDVFDSFYKYTTVTNESGDYMLFGVPTGTQQIHVDIDLSDIGVLSQAPRDMEYKGYGIKQFDSPNKFKKSTNLDSLPQIITENTSVFVYPFWGDPNQGEIAISKKNINIQYKFEPTCVFMGSIFTDQLKGGISKTCVPSKESGVMSEMSTSQGSIEMIRETIDGKIENYSINGNRLINSDGVWCYQIPMNLDYVITDELGNIVPSDSPTKGIPTRTNVRFRISLDNNGDSFVQSKTASYLIPNKPNSIDEEDYEFGSNCKKTSMVNLMWNKVYTVKNYIPRISKKDSSNDISVDRRFNGLKSVNYHGSNNPVPYNNIFVNLNLRFILICTITTFIIMLIGLINRFIIAPLKYVSWVGGFVKNLSPIVISKNIFGESECLEISLPNSDYLVPQYNGKIENDFNTYTMSMGILNALSQKTGHDYKVRATPGQDGTYNNWSGVGTIDDYNNSKHSKYTILISEDGNENGEGLLIGNITANKSLESYLNTGVAKIKVTGSDDDWYPFKESFVAYEAPNRCSGLTETLTSCIETQLSVENQIVNFDFTNDWLNGSLYAPRYLTKSKKNEKTGKLDSEYCGSLDVNNNLYLVQTCAVTIDKNGNFPNASNDNTECYGNTNNKCYKKNYTKAIGNGVIKQNTNDKTLYYRAVEFPGASDKNKYIQPTGIVLLGSLNDCDLDGIPQLHQLLPQTSFKLPPDSFLPDEDKEKDVQNSDKYGISEGSDPSFKSMSGIDWGNDPSHLENGLFIAVSCSDSNTITKTCVNASRLCEVGVDFDEKYTGYTGNSGLIRYIDGYISNDEISSGDVRGMFATLNGNNLKTKLNEYKQVKYDFSYLYPNSFDGRLRTLGYDKNKDFYGFPSDFTYNQDARLDYYKFRFGLTDSSQIGYDYLGEGKFPRYENSYYFYFGLKPGLTALDLFNTQFFVPCSEPKPDAFNVKLTLISNETCKLNDGSVDISITDCIYPYNMYLNDNSHMERVKSTDVIHMTGLTHGNYTFKVIDGNGDEVIKYISIAYIPCYEYSSELVGGVLEQEYTPQYEYTVLLPPSGDTDYVKEQIMLSYEYSSELVGGVLEQEYTPQYEYTVLLPPSGDTDYVYEQENN